MKKIDILNFITSFRKSPNDIKTYSELMAHLGAANEAAVAQMLEELRQAAHLTTLQQAIVLYSGIVIARIS